MALSNELAKLFAKTTNDNNNTNKTEATVYGTIVDNDGTKFVKLDGSEVLTPIKTTASVKNGDRVTVMLKNHTAMVTGNITTPSASSSDVDALASKVDQFEIIVADVVTTEELQAEVARIDTVVADNVIIHDKLDAMEAEIGSITAGEVTTEQLNAVKADIETLETSKLDAITADITYATITDLKAAEADISELEADNVNINNTLTALAAEVDTLEAESITTEYLDANYASIDLANVEKATIGTVLANVGLITDATITNGKVTGYLDAVSVNANSITAGTLSVDRLVFRGGTESIVYELNNITGALQAVQGDTLNGEILTDRSITVDKIVANSITANEIAAGTITADELNINNIFANSSVLNTLTAQDAFINAISTNSIVVGASNNATAALNAANNACPFITGTQTASTGSWTGVAPFSSLVDGQQITYWLPYTGSTGGNTLNLTLSDGSTTGAIVCYYGGTTRITTHYQAGSAIRLTYRNSVNVNGSTVSGWWADANYDSGNTFDRTRYTGLVKAASAITIGNIIVGNSSGYHNLKTGGSFDISYPILIAGSAIVAYGAGTNNYIIIANTITPTQSLSLTAYKGVYIKGTLNGTTFTPISTAPLTQTIPTVEDGYSYILLGTAYSTTDFYLIAEHPVYQFINGSFQQVGSGATNVIKEWSVTENGATYINGGNIYTGSITADKINVTDLSAICATIGKLSIDENGILTSEFLHESVVEEGSLVDDYININYEYWAPSVNDYKVVSGKTTLGFEDMVFERTNGYIDPHTILINDTEYDLLNDTTIVTYSSNGIYRYTKYYGSNSSGSTMGVSPTGLTFTDTIDTSGLWNTQAKLMANTILLTGDTIVSKSLTAASVATSSGADLDTLAGTALGSNTNYVKFGNYVIQWGLISMARSSNTTLSSRVTFPIAFADSNYTAHITLVYSASAPYLGDVAEALGGLETSYMDVRAFSKNSLFTTTNITSYIVNARWVAIGRWQ